MAEKAEIIIKIFRWSIVGIKVTSPIKKEFAPRFILLSKN